MIHKITRGFIHDCSDNRILNVFPLKKKWTFSISTEGMI